MADPIVTAAEPSISTLATGIITDVQELIKQQLALFQHEIKDGVNKAKNGTFVLLLGLGSAFAGVCLAGVTAAFLLHWAKPDWPLWPCFAIPSAVLLLAGGVALVAGKKMLDHLRNLGQHSLDEMNENVQCILKHPA